MHRDRDRARSMSARGTGLALIAPLLVPFVTAAQVPADTVVNVYELGAVVVLARTPVSTCLRSFGR